MSAREPSDDGRADVMVGAVVRARKLRFKRKPKTEVKFDEHVEVNERVADALEEHLDERIEAESDSVSERENLPEEVEPGVTYRNVRAGWVGGARLKRRDDD